MHDRPLPTLVGHKLRESQIFKDYQDAFENATGLPLQLHAAGEAGVSLKTRPRSYAFCALMATANQSCTACYTTIS